MSANMMAVSLVDCAGRPREALGPPASICAAERLDLLRQHIILLTLQSKMDHLRGGAVGREIRARAGAATTGMNNQTPSDFCLRPAEPSDYPFALALYLEG